MCGQVIVLDSDSPSKHLRCHACLILLEPELNEKTLCRCGKYHNTPAEQDRHYCRPCMGEEVLTGTPKGEPVRISAEED